MYSVDDTLAIVLVKDGKATLIRRRLSYEDLMATWFNLGLSLRIT